MPHMLQTIGYMFATSFGNFKRLCGKFKTLPGKFRRLPGKFKRLDAKFKTLGIKLRTYLAALTIYSPMLQRVKACSIIWLSLISMHSGLNPVWLLARIFQTQSSHIPIAIPNKG